MPVLEIHLYFKLGKKDGVELVTTIDLYDRYCPDTDVISMARTTGYTATAALRMMAQGIYTTKGISPPEFMGRYPECVDFMQSELKNRGVNWRVTVSEAA